MRVVLVAFVLSFVLGGHHATAAAATTDTTPPSEAPMVTDNGFIPVDVNIGDCLSSMPRPGCGSANRSGYHQLITFGVLMAGTAFITWRVARSVRARDR